ncbi:hypothetical protein D4R71_06040 [bacterium]|nr:MAG: hypothetical protein D4R71_06040 [bacterium]
MKRNNHRLLIIFILLTVIIISNLESQIEVEEIFTPESQEIKPLLEITPPEPQKLKLSSISDKKISFIWDQNPPIITDIKTCDEICNTHFNASINCTYKEAIKNSFIKNRLTKEKWVLENKQLAVPAKNHKVVFQNVKGSSYIFRVTSNRSLLVKTGNIEQQAEQYYNCYTIRTPYFLVRYKDREIPTYLPDMTLELLEKWEKALLKQNNITKEYFDKHIFVYNVRYDFWDKVGINEPFTFIIDYYFEVDWAKTHLKDYYVLEKHEHPKLKYHQTKITRIDPIESVIPMQEVIDKVSSISDSIFMNVNNLKLYRRQKNKNIDSKITYDIRFLIEFQGNFDFKNNRCLMGKMYLDTGEVETKKTCIYLID